MCCHCNRREFLGISTAALASATFALNAAAIEPVTGGWNPEQPLVRLGKPLRVQPILMYRVAERKPQTSWKSWGGVQDEASAQEESGRIAQELEALRRRADFEVEFLAPRLVRSEEEAVQASAGDFHATLIYPASGGGKTLNACAPDGKDALIFVRHRSGPMYYFYESLSTEYLRQNDREAPADDPRRFSVDDVVVDETDELLWRLRALYAVRNLCGTRVFTLGGSWGKYAPDAPRIAQEKFGLEIVEFGYEQFEPLLQAALQDSAVMTRAAQAAERYLKLPGTSLETEKPFVVNAFVLHELFKQLMAEHDCGAFTIKSCMGTIMPMAATTACLTLETMNDEGQIALCESDYVVVPAGILLRHLAQRPVFMHNSTFPHGGLVTCAHCTSPRRMDGQRYEPARIVTHYESEYGAAPKVEFPIGQPLTFIDPEYTTGRWVGFRGKVQANPFYDICRSQQEVTIEGDWRRLINEVRDSHWMMVYGDFLKEAGFAARRLGPKWDNITDGSLDGPHKDVIT
ncbi:MAG: sugar isomerase [Candidatus Hydrogenedentes bacterium]|nr:sugar isomerase [Candidatus Hydrogenedentota bacterium]